MSSDKSLEIYAGELWQEGIKTRLTISDAQCERIVTELTQISDKLNEPSLAFAALKLAFLHKNQSVHSINIMGTMGCGKNSLGRGVAKILGYEYVDADLFHSKENKEKMSKGIPLTTEDRIPFLGSVREFLRSAKKITSCSALTPAYRAFVSDGSDELLTVPSKAQAPWAPYPKNLGVVFLCLMKPYEVALMELDYAYKYDPRVLEDGTPHFIKVTKENSTLLKSQYDLLNATPLKPWEALFINTEDYRMPVEAGNKAPTAYDAKRMVRETIERLGA